MPRRDPNRVWDLVHRYRALANRFPRFELADIGAVERFGLRFPVLAGSVGNGPRSAIVLAGTHGDEIAGPLALLQFWEDAANHAITERIRFLFLPLINPIGYARGIRGNGIVDLNRHFERPTAQPENEIVLDFLRQERAELLVSLHEDVSAHCFYMYESGVRERALFAQSLPTTWRCWTRSSLRGTPYARATTWTVTTTAAGSLCPTPVPRA